jgi:hypothetical protein
MRKPICLVGLLVIASLVGGPGVAQARSHVRPTGELDCNGFSPLQSAVKANLPCVEIAANSSEGFEDNGHYVGHDEADIGWFSNRPGSGYSMQYRVTLPHDPKTPPNGSARGPVWNFQREITRWFGMVMCDNQSYPEGSRRCVPDSDQNIQVPPRPDHAGAAYMELQLYPPGYPPFIRKISCSRTQWCAALTIDSLQADYGALHGPGSPPNAVANPNCSEPVNFAFLTRSGHPVGPPGPDQVGAQTFTPTPDVLAMNPGDRLVVTLHDTPAGLMTRIADLTTGQTGTMTASAANGFRHILWDPVNFTCHGAAYSFHPMYATAARPLTDGQPTGWTTWSAHTDNIAISGELGHFEAPESPTDFDDAGCFQGPFIPGCVYGSDTDFDGYSYHPDWPNGEPQFGTPIYMSSPRSPNSGGRFTNTYRLVRFETDLPRIEEANSGPNHCNHHTGSGCVNPPPAPGSFYPWYHLARQPSTKGCAWTLSNNLPNQLRNFGGEQNAWGPLELTDYGFDKRYHNFARLIPNPCQ